MSYTELTVHEFLESLRDGKYAHGGYPKFWLASGGETLSFEACLENVWQIARAIRDRTSDGWRVVAYDANWEDPNMYCAHTNKRIESAYADDGIERDSRRIGVYRLALVELPDYAYSLRVKYSDDRSEDDSTEITLSVTNADLDETDPDDWFRSLNSESAIVNVLATHGYDPQCNAVAAQRVTP